MAMGAPVAHAGMGERARRFSGWVCAAGNLPGGSGVELVQSERDPHRRTAAEDCLAKESAKSGMGKSAFGGGEPGQSLWMAAAPAHLFLSLEPLPDGSH